MNDRKISELTVAELQTIIKETVQKSVAEVMIEFAMVADLEAELAFEAEMNDLVRNEMHAFTNLPLLDIDRTVKVDD